LSRKIRKRVSTVNLWGKKKKGVLVEDPRSGNGVREEMGRALVSCGRLLGTGRRQKFKTCGATDEAGRRDNRQAPLFSHGKKGGEKSTIWTGTRGGFPPPPSEKRSRQLEQKGGERTLGKMP